MDAADVAFAYPSGVHERRHGPQGYTDYRSFKPWLRDEFTFRCVYCLFRELWWPHGADSFGVDHILPRRARPDLECDYENLAYACNRCNQWKGPQGGVPSPCEIAYGDHVRVAEDGSVEARSAVGVELIKILGLDAPTLTSFRRRLLSTLRMLASHPRGTARIAEWMGFPADLPDLACLRPPGGNTRPEGITQSYSAQHDRAELPSTY